MRKSAGLLLFLAALSSCSVKEDRTGCPCTLLVDLAALSTPGGWPKSEDESLTLSIYEPELIMQRNIELSENQFCVELPRGVMTVSAVLGNNSIKIRDGAMKINCGEQSDSLYAFCNTIGAYSDTVAVSLRLCKQFSTVSIRIAEAADFYCRIIGNVNGISMTTLKPTAGEFDYVMDNDSENGNWVFRMPRQSDKSITMEIRDRTDDTVVAVVPLGELLETAGYEWDADNLQDVSLDVDPVSKHITVAISTWDNGRIFEFVY